MQTISGVTAVVLPREIKLCSSSLTTPSKQENRGKLMAMKDSSQSHRHIAKMCRCWQKSARRYASTSARLMRYLLQDATLIISLTRTLMLLVKPHKGVVDVSVAPLAMTGTATEEPQIRNCLLKCIKIKIFHDMARTKFK